MSMSSTLIQMIKEVVGEPTIGVEVGVYKGQTSKALLKTFPGLTLVMVDPWKEWDDKASYRGHKKTGNITQSEWDSVREEAVENVSNFWPRTCIIQNTSQVTAHLSRNIGFDFVFIDANHMYEMVKQDIELWFPICTGLICGHDFGGFYKGVKRAVEEVFKKDKLILPGDKLWGVALK